MGKEDIINAIIENFNFAYNEWGFEEFEKKDKNFIDEYIDRDFYDMRSCFLDYEDWRDYVNIIPKLKKYENKSDYDVEKIKSIVLWQSGKENYCMKI